MCAGLGMLSISRPIAACRSRSGRNRHPEAPGCEVRFLWAPLISWPWRVANEVNADLLFSGLTTGRTAILPVVTLPA